MPEPTEGRVAVYIDFDNIVISRYNQLHGKGVFQRDKARDFVPTRANQNTEVGARFSQATVDVGAILDFASSFGTIVISRAYADWSVPVNASYKQQLIDRAVDLTQLFPTVVSMKNGADIRLAVDVVEDLFRLPDLTHVVIVAGDSDFIALAQRCRRLGRYVVGIGVAGGTSKALTSACDEFADYDALPSLASDDLDLDLEADPVAEETAQTSRRGSSRRASGSGASGAAGGTAADDAPANGTTADGTTGNGPTGNDTATDAPDEKSTVTETEPQAARKTQPARRASAAATKKAKPVTPDSVATDLLVRAMRLVGSKQDTDWINSSALKNQMLRMDPAFSERALGFSKFTDFVKSRSHAIELKEDGQTRLFRLHAVSKASE